MSEPIVPRGYYWHAAEDETPSDPAFPYVVYECRTGQEDDGDDVDGVIANELNPEYAHLISAAPDLLAACETTLAALRYTRDRLSDAAYHEVMTPELATAWDALKAAIAKARAT